MDLSSYSYPWAIFHKVGRDPEHLAWLQRSLMPGDFAPAGKARNGTGTGFPIPNYVVYPSGVSPDPHSAPVCQGCHTVPRNEQLEPMERSSRLRGFLAPFRSGRKSWARAGTTDPQTCYVCNYPIPLARDGYVKICVECEANLAKGGQ